MRGRHRRTLSTALLATLLLAPVGSGTAATAASSAPGPAVIDPASPYVDGQVLVGFRPGVGAAARDAAVAQAEGKTVQMLGKRTRKVRVRRGEVAAAIRTLRARSEVAYAEPNYIRAATLAPNDTNYAHQWAMPKIDAPAAWDTTTGSPAVVVAVLDTGIDYTHADLVANMWTNPGGVFGCPAGTHGYDAVHSEHCAPFDDHKHGTHVAGIIGATGNNATGVTGVNWRVSLLALKVLDDLGHGFDSNVIIAMHQAVLAKQAGANIRVINASFGGGAASTAMSNAIDEAGAAGILFVAAAGNDSSNTDVSPFYPCSANRPTEMCVASTTLNDSLSSFSNYGTTVDLAAPGSSIRSTVPGGYGWFNGTSMATPHVAGAAALILARPECANATPAALKASLRTSVDPIGLPVATGGRLNVARAIATCSDIPSLPPPGWEAIGGRITGNPAAVSAGPGRVDVFGRGSDATLQHTWYDGQWHALESLGGALASDPSAVSIVPGTIDVAARDVNGRLVTRQFANGQWAPWTKPSVIIATRPIAASRGSGILDLFATKSTHVMLRRTRAANGRWRSTTLRGPVSTDPALSLIGPETYQVFAGTPNGSLGYGILNRSWRGLTPANSAVANGSTPVAVTAADGASVVSFSRAPDGSLRYTEVAGATSSSGPLGLTARGDAAAIAVSGLTQVFAVGVDGRLQHRAFGDATGAWNSLGGVFTGTPAAVVTSAGTAELFARDATGALFHRTWPAQ